MRRVNLKSGLVIVIYSLILTLVLIFGIYGVRSSFSNLAESTSMKDIKYFAVSSNLEENRAILNYMNYGENSLENIYGNVETINSIILRSNRLTDASEIGRVYLSIGFENIAVTILMFFSIFIIASILLWIILNKIHDKEIENIVNKLNDIDDDFDPALISRSFGIAYENIKDKFNQTLDEYKRLNSYLSHEQKNAIAILRTNLEIDNNQEYLKFIDNISDSIDDVLTLSDVKIDKGLTEVDVSLICASICDGYRKTYRNIEFDFDDESNTIILAKERWIYRAISNLVDNAVKYGEGKPIKVSVENKKNTVVITVEDQGIGMDKNSIGKIFNNKYRINELNKDGYGIGLSLVSHVCDLCDGFVIVDSEINKGSCFYLAFSEYKI
ncbi:histidine kinase [Clostridium sulfidigenes]|uniref:histidine kinase n=1 Tax=Clostridium sulfidigenes TaxID=318464 RepID=A0A084J7P0_9CLOT|nr:HAMP domain-containing sensor histidine kinase [Clostridium sulfidigenes]KEZ84974.1 histidine kinase [Clostridium sulfidigenes]